jgi:hypothetical protein
MGFIYQRRKHAARKAVKAAAQARRLKASVDQEKVDNMVMRMNMAAARKKQLIAPGHPQEDCETGRRFVKCQYGVSQEGGCAAYLLTTSIFLLDSQRGILCDRRKSGHNRYMG